LLANTEAPQRILVMKQQTAGEHFRRALKRIADFGWIRRECLDHIVIFNQRHLRRVLSSYVDYYQHTRTHLSLGKDCPDPRPIQPRRIERVVALPKVGGLHHRYERLAA
jgi:hypothetical protein